MLIPRVFWIALGAGAGVLVVTRAQRLMRRATPASIADRAGVTAQGAGEQVQGWWSTVKGFAAEREAELRNGLGLDIPDNDPTKRKAG